MQFISTRGNERVTGAQAIVKGIADDGGLFVPASFPTVSQQELEGMLAMDYPERAAFILRRKARVSSSSWRAAASCCWA